MVSIFNWLTFISLCIKCLSIRGEIFYVSTFGAFSDDNIDDTTGIQLTIKTAINYGPNNIVIFGFGIYNLSSSIIISNATNLTVQGQGIDQTFLIGNLPLEIFSVQNCEELTISLLSIDFDPLPFTAGYIVNVNDTYIDVKIQPPHRADVDKQIRSILRYDPVHMRPAFGQNTYEIYQVPPTNVNTSLVSANILSMPLRLPSKFAIGDAVVARYNNPYNAIAAINVTAFTVQSITIYTSWSMGLVTVKSRRLNIINFHVLRRNGRWLSSSTDCMHFISIKEYINLIDSKCQAMGDDGFNVHSTFLLVTKIISSKTIIVTAMNGTDSYVENGTHLEFSSNEQPFTVRKIGIVASSTRYNSSSRLLTFTTSINASLNYFVSSADTPVLTIRNFTVENNRARGVLLGTRNIDIRNSVFNRTSGSAVLIQPSLYWYEGPVARNITLINNLYINCNEGIAKDQGIITIRPNPTQLVPVINGIRIESSTFLFGNYSLGLIRSTNADNVFLSGNYITTNITTPIILLCNSRNITASNNTVFNHRAKPNQYYTFDTMYPCQMNLSSLIDLPSSAFNSSFAPPV
ncbi:hypothetical protein I4U23_016446 [Adineta vaga]|nr:hypothetical protein I4U23_016446 [Adineta vaga]